MLTQKKTAHIISHTHWDREWYMPFEYHHMLLVELMDTLLDTLDSDPNYKYFHLDGQTIVIEDYLQVRPNQRERLERHIKEGRIHIGPWYILQDEFLTSSEANIRNLLTGHKDAAKYGVISKVGYFPDSFGNMGQAPQIMEQAGINNAVFGRGVKPTGFNNTVGESDTYESPYSEMIWQSPDGSQVLGILFANWYCNGMEVPVDKEAAQAYWDKNLKDAEQFASTPHLLFMNGCDHQPIQTDLSKAIETASELYPDIRFKHSNFDEYIADVAKAVPSDLTVIEGELRSQHTDGWGTLVNTASARVYLKQMNQQAQTLLEKVAEPLAVFAHLDANAAYPHDELTYAWKTLMQNHPHDSICGCSVDEVHQEMETRFLKSRNVAESLIHEATSKIVKQINTLDVEAWDGNDIPFTVFNTAGWTRSGAVEVELVVAKKYFPEGPSPQALAQELKQIALDNNVIMDANGDIVPAQIEDLGVHFDYELPKDRFRQPYMARKVKVTLLASEIPALGYKVFAYGKSVSSVMPEASVQVDGHTMENSKLRATVEGDGTLTLQDKVSGHTYTGLNAFENTGDIGNEYVYRQPDGEVALTTKGLNAQVTVVEQSAVRAVIEAVLAWEIPASANEKFVEEKREFVPFRDRTAVRTTEMIPFTITTRYTLEGNSRLVKVKTSFNNQAKDHRLRALFPTGLRSEHHYADSIFEVAQRNTQPAKEWINPSNCQHQGAFVSVHEQNRGLTIANKGLQEYEVLQGEENTIAVTLLRAVSELGDWGVFETPEAQCLGEQAVEYAIIPHAEDGISSHAYALAYQFQIPWTAAQTELGHGTLPTTYSWLSWNEAEASLAFSTFKLSEGTSDVIARFYNLGKATVPLTTELAHGTGDIYVSDVLERRHELMNQGKAYEVGPYKIVTLSYPL
ncbi:alpha-mannosidase [Paenibacillus sanguinis]|uniref:alpha-mannosidase n=1 Tax=Paenibacillus sanguinis TaxID=225906 RepID=UPI00036298BB|nr:alpha-mannosidase [Paenibacillus sanguinis]